MLNPQQMAAVKYIDGPLLVLAGAGSGKTRVITQKIAYLIKECEYKAQNVYAVTFTNKAANEMRERVNKVLAPAERRGLSVSTFHTLGLNIIKKEIAVSGLKKGFSIFDSEDSLHLLKSFLPQSRANDKETLFSIQQLISRWKNGDDLYEHPLQEEALRIYPLYQRALQAYNAVDFDDLIRLPVEIFHQHPLILEKWQQKIRHLLIDEYQDSNASQYLLVKLLVGERARFTVVGDDDQSIYAWRGAKPENLALLQTDFPQLKIIKLEQNYRSAQRILHAANHLIANNTHLFEKKLWSNLGYGDPLKVICCKSEQDEAEQVIADLISHKFRHRTEYGDYAILYRGNHQSRIFEKQLRQQGISYRISGGQSWFSRAEVRDIFAYLKLLCNADDDAAFLRVINTPKRGIGETTLSHLAQYAQNKGQSLFNCCDHIALTGILNDKQRSTLSEFKQWLVYINQQCESTTTVSEILREMVEDMGYEAYIYEQCDSPAKAQKKMDNVWDLLAWVQRLLEKDEESSLVDVINKLILIDILEQTDEKENETVQLLTLHAAKGLEFPHVYLVGMEEELLPHKVSMEEEQIDEERRLAYVGITRAQKTICFTLAKKRRRGSELQDCLPSRFLDELPPESLEWYGKMGESNELQSKALAKSHIAGLKSLLGTELD